MNFTSYFLICQRISIGHQNWQHPLCSLTLHPCRITDLLPSRFCHQESIKMSVEKKLGKLLFLMVLMWSLDFGQLVTISTMHLSAETYFLPFTSTTSLNSVHLLAPSSMYFNKHYLISQSNIIPSSAATVASFPHNRRQIKCDSSS